MDRPPAPATVDTLTFASFGERNPFRRHQAPGNSNTDTRTYTYTTEINFSGRKDTRLRTYKTYAVVAEKPPEIR